MAECPSDAPVWWKRAGDDVAGDCFQLIRVRWFASGLIMVATGVAGHVLRFSLPEGWLYATGIGMLAYNSVAAWLYGRAKGHNRERVSRLIRREIALQLALDWLALMILIHLTGGVSSPVSAFLIAHVVIVAVMLRGPMPYIVVAVDVVGLALITLLEGVRIIPRYGLMTSFVPDLYTDPVIASLPIAAVALAGVVAARAMQVITGRLQRHEDRMTALLSSIGTVSSARSLSDLLDTLTRISVETLSAQGGLMRVRDEASHSLPVASAFGLNEAFLRHATGGLTRQSLESEIMAGKAVIILDMAKDSRVDLGLQSAELGARSLVAAPIVGRAQPFGLVCVYSNKPYRFADHDAEFVLAIGRQTGNALEQATIYENLQRVEQERARFVTMITHELRAPVAGTQVLLKTLVRGIAGNLNEQQRDILARIENRIEMLMALVNDLLSLAASKTIDTEEPLQRVLLRPVLRQVVDRFGKEAEMKEVVIALDIPFEAVSVRATELGLTRILDNLIGNAIKYTPAGGHVCVGVVERPVGVVITVEDTGIGIPKEDMPRIMGGFFRARNARESGIIGTGLGLSIVRQFVDFFGGSINIDSEAGKGTTIKVTLQRAGPADDPALSGETEAGV